MVVVALRGSNIPVLPIPEYSSALFLKAKVSAYSYGNAEENRAELPQTRDFFPAAGRKLVRRRPMWSIDETE